MAGRITRDIIERKIGEKITNSKIFSKPANSGPIMIPPIPDSKFIGTLPEGDLEGPNLQEKQHQDAYEAEVKLYRSLEELKKNYVVIHQLKFTHEQYSVFVKEHNCNKKLCERGEKDHPCHKQLRQIEGECDFVVVGANFVVIFEVKALTLQNADVDKVKFVGCCESALLQRKRMKDLVKSIDRTVVTFEFTVFPNISINDVEERYLNDETIIFSEDLQYITSIVASCEEFSRFLVPIKFYFRGGLCRCLTGLWCIDQENKWDLISCELTKCIKDIDQKLRGALVTREAVDSETYKTRGKGKAKRKKIYPENPEMVEAPDLFKSYLNISCLTKDQLDVFNSEERFLWVEGPAGSGKTITMLGKIIDIVKNKSAQSRVLLYSWEGLPAVQHYYKILNSIFEERTCAVVTHYYKNFEGDYYDKMAAAEKSLSNKLIKYSKRRIVILLMEDKEVLTSPKIYEIMTSFNYVFVDDYQKLIDITADINDIKNTNEYFSECNIFFNGLQPLVKNRATNNTSLWVFCDMGQSCSNPVLTAFDIDGKKVLDEFKNMFESQKKLSVNVRNTYEIATVLSVIREHYNKMDLTNKSNLLGLLPQQRGHFLRGTKPTIYLKLANSPAAFEGILEEELKLLRGRGSSLDQKKIGIMYHTDLQIENGFELSNSICRCIVAQNASCRYTLYDIYDVIKTNACSSAEWTAIIYIFRFYSESKHTYVPASPTGDKQGWFSDLIPFLYTALSRARVHSTVIIYNYTPFHCEYTDKMLSDLYRNYRDVCKMIVSDDIYHNFHPLVNHYF